MDKELRDEVNHFKNALKDVPYFWRKIRNLGLDLDYMEYEMTGLSHYGVTLTKEQERSPLPMPHYTSSRSLVDRIFEVDKIKDEIEFCRKQILQCEAIERLSQEEKKILLDVFVFKVNQWDMAASLGISRQGLNRRINSMIKKCL